MSQSIMIQTGQPCRRPFLRAAMGRSRVRWGGPDRQALRVWALFPSRAAAPWASLLQLFGQELRDAINRIRAGFRVRRCDNCVFSVNRLKGFVGCQRSIWVVKGMMCTGIEMRINPFCMSEFFTCREGPGVV